MNPLTDKITTIPDGHGGFIELRQPGALVVNKPLASRNWRLSPEAFARYRPHLLLGITNMEKSPPIETSFDVPPDLSPNTFAARFRDARQALLDCGYDPQLEARLRALTTDPVISLAPDGKQVWFRARGRHGRPVTLTVQQIKRPSLIATDVTDMPTSAELDAMCLLIHAKRFSGVFHFRGRIDDATKQALEAKYDISFTFDELANTTRLI